MLPWERLAKKGTFDRLWWAAQLLNSLVFIIKPRRSAAFTSWSTQIPHLSWLSHSAGLETPLFR